MSMLRTMLMAFLLVAVLPWGAYLGRFPGAAQGRVGAETVAAYPVSAHASTPRAEAVQKPLIKCRKGIAGSTCTPDPKALLSSIDLDRRLNPGRLGVDRASSVPDGIVERPTPPPPRPV